MRLVVSLVSKISKSNQLLSHCNNKQKAKYTQAGVGTIVLLVPIKKMIYAIFLV